MGSSEYWSSDFHIQAKEGEKFSGSRRNQPCNKVFPLGFLVSETHLASQEAAGRDLAPAILITQWGPEVATPARVSYLLSHMPHKLLRQEPRAQEKGSPSYHHCHHVGQQSTGGTQRQGQVHSKQRADTTKSTFTIVILTPQVLGQSTVQKKQAPFHFKSSGTKYSVAQQVATGLSGKGIWLTLVSVYKSYRAEDMTNEVYLTCCLESLTNNYDCLMKIWIPKEVRTYSDRNIV